MKERKEATIILIEKIDDCYNDFTRCDIKKGYEKLKDYISDINKIFMEFIAIIPKLKELGVDIPSDVLIQQLKNLLEAYEYRDSMLLADTLRYEIIDTLSLYVEIMEELDKENISL